MKEVAYYNGKRKQKGKKAHKVSPELEDEDDVTIEDNDALDLISRFS